MTSTGDVALARYNSNGTLDVSFNGTGTVSIHVDDTTANSWAVGWSMVLQSDGKIVVAGVSNTGGVGDEDFMLVRCNADGSLDTTFNATGKVVTLVSGRDICKSVALQSDGRIVVAGFVGNSFRDFAVARYEGGPFTPIQQWKFAQLGSVNVSDFDDVDGDGLAHLAEYALNLSPTIPSIAPPAERFAYADGERLRMFFTRDPARNDITIEAQAASDTAGPWSTIATSALGGVTTGPGYVGGDSAGAGLKTVEVRDTLNFSDAPQRFLRLRVTH